MATLLTPSSSNLVHSHCNHSSLYFLGYSPSFLDKVIFRDSHKKPKGKSLCRHIVSATTKGSEKSSESDEKIPSWAKPDSNEPPPWAREDGKSSSEQAFEIPFYVYLLASAITAIAAIGSVFEYANQKPIFGVVDSDSIFYAPILGFFAITGVPTSAFLWFKSVQVANKEAKEQDRRDGFQ